MSIRDLIVEFALAIANVHPAHRDALRRGSEHAGPVDPPRRRR